MVWRSGHQLQGGRYTIIRPLGSGRFALTYLAEKQDGTKCVIKTLNNKIINQRDKRKIEQLQFNFLEEGRALAACKHPHIVKAQKPFQETTRNDWGKQISQVCIPMEYIEGKTLNELSLPLSEEDALKYIEQIARALIIVHKNKLLHRDIKLSNIMIRDKTDEAILIDFGLAKEFDEDLTELNPTVSDGFSPPELYYSKAERGSYTDVYSLSASLYVLLTATIPPKATERHLHPLIFPQTIKHKISDRVKEGIIKGMEIERNRRPQTMEKWLEEVLNKKIQRKEPVLDPDLKLGRIQVRVEIISIIVSIVGILVTLNMIPIVSFRFPNILEALPTPEQKIDKNINN